MQLMGKETELISDGNELIPAWAAGKRLGEIAAKASKMRVMINFFV